MQALSSLSEQISKQVGCLRFKVYQETDKENELLLLQEWNTYRDLERHIRSDAFSILHGALTTLSDELDIRFDKVTLSTGPEMIDLVRVK